MAMARERDQLKTHPTPLAKDILFYEVFSDTLPKNKNYTYGEPHPNSELWPDHELVYVSASKDGKDHLRWYAAKRDHQDSYNFEFTAGSTSFRFDLVKRSYLFKRSEFIEIGPAMGSAMPNEPKDLFSSEYVLFQREQVRCPIQELDSLFIAEVRTYVKRVTISEVALDIQTGRSKRSTTNLYHKGEKPDPALGPIEELALDPTGPYWGLQPNGTFRELQQISADWYSITESTAIPGNSVISPTNPGRAVSVKRVTPLGTDLLFYEVGAMPDPVPAYGDAHYSASWPNHKLVFIEPADEQGLLYRFYYAADRGSQDLYNFEDNQGASLTRTYLLTRAEYLDRPTYLASVPVVASADAVFNQYVFAMESAKRVPEPLDSLYVAIERIYLPPIRRDIEYNPTFERNVVTIQEVIPHGTGTGSVSAGRVIEIKDVNTWYDMKITREIENLSSITFPITLAPIPATVPYRFPPWLKSVSIESAWAVASSTGFKSSYSEDFFFRFELSDPSMGPYQATILRFITNNPSALQATYPIIKITTQREGIGITAAWFFASSEVGNSTYAMAKEIEIPSSIHGALTIPLGFVTGGSSTSGKDYTDSLSATPNFSTIISATQMTVGYECSQLPLGLFEVKVTRINTSGLYT